MEINLSILDEYFNERMPVAVLFNLNDSEPELIFQPTKDPNTSRREFLSFKDINNIFELNGINVKVRAVLNDTDITSREKKINDLVYDTLAKYVLQMLNGASIAKILYPELIPLEKHKLNHFRNQ